jgi:hypothetical protein
MLPPNLSSLKKKAANTWQINDMVSSARKLQYWTLWVQHRITVSHCETITLHSSSVRSSGQQAATGKYFLDSKKSTSVFHMGHAVDGWRLWRLRHSAMSCYVVWYTVTNISMEYSAVFFYPEDGYSRFLQNDDDLCITLHHIQKSVIATVEIT